MSKKLRIGDQSPLEEAIDHFEEKRSKPDPEVCVACGRRGPFSRGFCQVCIRPDGGGRFPNIPHMDDFGTSDYIAAPDLMELAGRVINAYAEDLHERIGVANIRYLWRRAGGTSHGRDRLGYLKCPGGELRYFSDADFLLCVAADHCKYFSKMQMTALVFHELKHADFNIDTYKFTTVGHDFEGFRREVELFGYWRDDIRLMGEAFEGAKQLDLFDLEAAIEAL